MLTWLHLSDLQLQKESGQAVVLKQLLDDVERLREENLRPDFICVTGDVADSGQPDEYGRAREFFDDLLHLTSVSRERLFIIPGNHDIDERMFKEYVKLAHIPGTLISVFEPKKKEEPEL